MDIRRIRGAVEAVLFASGEAVPVERIADVLKLDRPTAEKILADLADRFNSEHSGVRIVRFGDGYQMCSNPDYAGYVREMMDIRRNTPLSQAAMEVLAVVAYNQPVTKAFVEQVRGVDCSGVISSLAAKGLVEERGRLELPGRPLVYGTTSDFLRCLNISSLSELPPVSSETAGKKEAAPEEAAREEEPAPGEKAG